LPELPEVESVRRQLVPAMKGARFVGVVLRRADLRTAFPPRFASRLKGRTVARLERRAKYLLAVLSSGDTLLMHLGMSGSFRVERAVHTVAHDHVVFRMSSGRSVTFNDPRRFGLMDLLTPRQLAAHATLSRLGPEPLSAAFDAAALARACRGKKTSLKAALLDQRVVGGLGNIYVVEALYLARLSPLRRASTIATPSGAPRPAAFRLAAAIKKVLEDAVDRTSKAYRQSDRFRVYDRAGERCRTPRCSGSIAQRTQAGRTSYYCPICQR
jgi:formamidopyrimidine-DNA glycosylase